jgi:hypothetical protein
MKAEESFFKREAVWTLLLGLAPILFGLLLLLIFWLARKLVT